MNSEKEKLLKETYDTFLNLMLYDQPLDSMNEYIVDDVMGYGTTLDEKILDIERLRKLVIDQREQGADAKINFDVIPVFRSVTDNQEAAIFVDEIKISIIVDGAKNVMPLRFSAVFYYFNDKWMLVHLHGSVAVETEGDTWHINEWKQKNAELEKLVNEKTAELLNKNRELEIEAALEKVRSIAMGMKEPADMLEVCKTISLQLELLGVKEIRNVQTAIFYESKGTYLNYEYYRLHDKTFITEIDYNIHPAQTAFANEMLKSPEAFFTKSFKGAKLKEWVEHQSKTPQFVDMVLLNADSLNYYFHSIDPVALGISTYSPLTEDGLQLFKRLRNVFELAYRRFQDIEKAQAQAREAKIETALEKVRAVAMSMNKPDDLLNICEVLYKEFHSFGFSELRNAMINIHNDEEKTFLNYDYSDKIGKSINHLEYNIHPVIKKQIKQIRSSDDAFSETIFKGADLKSWKAFRKKIGEKDDSRINKSTALYYYFYSIGTGSIGISTFSAIGPEKLELLKRFRNVFNLSYQRYSDIALAEAQAREARIELALERVRARAMAMQNSNELSDLVDTVFKKLTKLDFALSWCIINIIDEPSLTNMVWAANPNIDEAPDSYHMKFEDYPFHHAMMKGYQEQKTKFIYVLEGLEKKIYDEYLFKDTEFRKVPKEAQAASRAMEKYVCSFTFSNFGGLQTVGDEPLSDINLDILERFGKVFDLTYTRFNDLLKAEAQTREAQIELGLERVRARAMAMQKTDELADAAQLLYHEFGILGIKTFSCGYMFIDEIKHIQTAWVVLPDGTLLPNFIVFPLTGDHVLDNRYESWKQKEPINVCKIQGEENKEHHRFLSNHVPPFVVEEIFSQIPDRIIFYCANFSDGYLLILATEHYSADEEQTIIRFAKVFEMTYRRFLDLKKAETQAREAQIELALERVRAKTMAMQRSDELQDAALLLFQQIQSLGVPAFATGFNIWDDDRKSVTAWMGGQDRMQPPFKTSGSEDIFLRICEAAKKGESLFVEEQGGEALKMHYKYMNTIPVFKEISDKMAKEGQSFPTFQIMHSAFFSHGYLMFITYEPVPDAYDIFKRFARVFEQTYTRFLDLQKAEAQAREAQIELALERVRARTMAMQKSEELNEVIQVVYDQFVQLTIHIEHTGFILDYKVRDDMHIWLADRHEIPTEVTIPYFDCAHWNSFNEAKANGKNFFANHLSFEEKNKFYQDLFEFIPGLPEDIKEYYFSRSGLAISTVLLENVGLYIENFDGIPYTENENNTLMRFGKVFQQTYTRFLDLQKAEAQAREAQIEAALERVRSRTMGMQKSEELKEVIRVVYKQFVHLKINVDHAGFVIDYTPKGDWHFWIADEQDIPSKITHPYFESVWANQFNEAKEKGADFFATNLNFEEKNKFYNELLSYIPGLPEASKKIYLSCPGLAGSTVLFDNVSLYIENFSGSPYSDEENKILMRFGNVFQQTYTRFLDLQKAEAQARESQIEAALEKVRSRSLAMHKSDELQDVVNTVFERLNDLKIDMNVASIFIFKDGSKDWEQWVASSTTNYSTYFYIPYMDLSVFRDLEEAKQKRKDFYSVRYSLEQKNQWFSYAFENTEYKQVPDDRKKYILESEFFLVSFALSKHSGIQLAKYEGKDFTQEENEILKRFARVFEQAYIRFLDLQKAEAQARESQIEAALERVRSRTMAMQKSEDLNKAASDMFKQIQVLGMQPWACGFNIFDKDEKDVTQYMSLADAGISPPFRTPLIEDPFFINIYEARQKKEKLLVMESSGESLAETYRYMFGLPGSREIFGDLENSGFEMPKFQITHCAYFSQGYLVFITYEPVPEAHDIFRRFAKVFEQTYTRFLDLQKAEAQARESQIEASLERVRSKAMAMYKSDDLTPAVATVFSELDRLSFRTVRCGIGIFNDLSEKVDVWTTSSNDKSGSVNLSGNEVLEGHPLLEGIFKAWKLQKDYSYVLEGKDLLDYYRVTSSSNLPVTAPEVTSETTKQYYHCIMFPSGGLFAFRESEFSTEAKNLMRRFADVFQLTFTRHLDLRKAEAQNKLIQAENERKTKELEDARQLQLSMLPRELPKVSNLDIAVYMKTATEVGGDYYDFHIQPDGTLNVLVGDATGHGMMSGMMVSIMKSFFIANRNNFELKHFFENSNISIKDMQLGRLMMACIGVQVTSKKVIATNAGMPSLLYFRNKSQKAGEFVINNMPLGAMKGSKYAIKELNYEKGDTLLLMSDGLAELKNQNQEQYGYPRVKKEFKSVVRKSSNEIIDYLKNSASEWANGVEPDDDLTFVVIKVK